MSNPVIHDICDLDRIYNSEYQYSLPRNLLESFLSGKAFDQKEKYSETESEKLRNDIQALYEKIINQSPIKEKLAVITAGAPGAGKTTKIRQELEEKLRQGKRYAYICPDDVCLQNQFQTYLTDLKNSSFSKHAQLETYNKWRPGSNGATHIILAKLIWEQYAFYFGTTASSPSTATFFEFLKAQGYRIKLLHFSASDEVRWESIKERDKTFVQTTEKDIQEKGLLPPQRIYDTFLKYADKIKFYYRDDVKQDARLVAKWQRNKENQQYLGTLQIYSLEDYTKIKELHNECIKKLNRPELIWEKTVENSCNFLIKADGGNLLERN